jgi:uncharacterized protein YndB with AHSA1/START domain
MTRIHGSVVLNRPAEQVFNYLTTPGNWRRWHPSTLGVTGAIDHPLEVGEECLELFRVAGRQGKARWTVREREAPRRWVIDGTAEAGGHATITYTLTPQAGGTLFERELVYEMPGRFWKLLDWLVLRHRIGAESARALRQLKQVLEPF